MSASLLEHLYPVFANLPAPLSDKFAAQARAVQIGAGTLLFDERQACRAFPLLLDGQVRVFKSAPSGRELPLYRLLPGDCCIITSACLLGNLDYNARGVAELASSLLVLPHALFEELLEQRTFREFVFGAFAARIADLMQRIDAVAFHRLDQRLAELLLGKGPRLQVTHQQLADELGSVREIVTRLLDGFAARGLVRLGRGNVEILDPPGLRKISG